MADTESSPAPILITGGNGAIGRATARALLREQVPVVLWTRDRSAGDLTRREFEEEFPAARVELVDGDVGEVATVRSRAAMISERYPRLGGLVHAAGALTRYREETREGVERMFATNYLGPFVLTQALTERREVRRPFRTVSIVSPSDTPLDFEDLPARRRFRSLAVYGASKTALALFAYALARRGTGGGQTSNLFFPGVVRSGLFRAAPLTIRTFVRMAGTAPDRAGEALAWICTGPPLATANGVFFDGTRVGTTSEYTHRIDVQDRLWEATERLLAGLGASGPSGRSPAGPAD